MLFAESRCPSVLIVTVMGHCSRNEGIAPTAILKVLCMPHRWTEDEGKSCFAPSFDRSKQRISSQRHPRQCLGNMTQDNPRPRKLATKNLMNCLGQAGSVARIVIVVVSQGPRFFKGRESWERCQRVPAKSIAPDEVKISTLTRPDLAQIA